MFVCIIRPILGRATRKTVSKNLLFYFDFPKKPPAFYLEVSWGAQGFCRKRRLYNFSKEFTEFFQRFAEIVILTVREFFLTFSIA